MLPPKLLNIMPILRPDWMNPDGFFFIVLMVMIVGVGVFFIFGAIRTTVYEFKEPERKWWKLTLKILLIVVAVIFLAITIFLWVMWSK